MLLEMPRLKVGRGGTKGFFLQQSLGAVRKMKIRFQVSAFQSKGRIISKEVWWSRGIVPASGPPGPGLNLGPGPGV